MYHKVTNSKLWKLDVIPSSMSLNRMKKAKEKDSRNLERQSRLGEMRNRVMNALEVARINL